MTRMWTLQYKKCMQENVICLLHTFLFLTRHYCNLEHEKGASYVMHLELYVPKYKMEEYMPNGYQVPIKRIDDVETFDKIVFSKHCMPMTRRDADGLKTIISLGVKAVLIDQNHPTTMWLGDEAYSKDMKMKVSIPGGHMEQNDDCETVEELLRWNLIRELYEELGYNVDQPLQSQNVADNLRVLGCAEAEEMDGWYYQYTSDYLCFFKLIRILPNSFVVDRQLLPFSINDYKELQTIRKYNPKHFQTLLKNNMNIGHPLTSDIRTSVTGRYSKMIPAIMHLLENLSANSDIHYKPV